MSMQERKVLLSDRSEIKSKFVVLAFKMRQWASQNDSVKEKKMTIYRREWRIAGAMSLNR